MEGLANLCASLFLLLLGAASLEGEQQTWKTKVLAPGLTLQVPDGLTRTRHRPTEDFEILVFHRGTNAILNVYVGNQPDFPKEKSGGPIQKETINGFQAETVMNKRSAGRISREVLLRLRDNGVWPQRMHCWYANLTADDSAEAERMVSSVHVAEKRLSEKRP